MQNPDKEGCIPCPPPLFPLEFLDDIVRQAFGPPTWIEKKLRLGEIN